MFQMRMTQLVRRQSYDELYFIILHKQGHMIMYYLLAIVYCCLSLLVACYAIFWNRTLGAETLDASVEDLAPDSNPEASQESNIEAEARLFLMSQSKVNDMLLYLPAAVQGLLYIVHMREIEQAFMDSSVGDEHIMLLPPNSTSDYLALSGPGPYSHTPNSQDSTGNGASRARREEAKHRPVNGYGDSDIEDYIKLSARPGTNERNTNTINSSKKSPKQGSFVVNLTDMIKDFDIHNRVSLQ